MSGSGPVLSGTLSASSERACEGQQYKAVALLLWPVRLTAGVNGASMVENIFTKSC